ALPEQLGRVGVGDRRHRDVGLMTVLRERRDGEEQGQCPRPKCADHCRGFSGNGAGGGASIGTGGASGGRSGGCGLAPATIRPTASAASRRTSLSSSLSALTRASVAGAARPPIWPGA